MKYRVPIVLGVLALLCIPFISDLQGVDSHSPASAADQNGPHQMTPEQLREFVKELLESQADAQPDTSSENWKSITDEIGMLVRRDQHGVTRGTLYLRIEESWRPVAIEGLAELGPSVIPAGRER